MKSSVDLDDGPVLAQEHGLISAVGQARRLREALSCEVVLEARGGASRTFRIAGTDHLVTVPLSWPEHTEPEAELVARTTLQERIASRVTLPVPTVVRAVPECGLLVVRRLPGVRLIDAAPAVRDAVRHDVATALGSLLAQLHTWERDAYDDVAVVDDYSPEDWRLETAELVSELGTALDDGQRRDVQRFLVQPAPSFAGFPVLSHNDLGIEHVLVSTTGGGPVITGVIDWDDAAICDPAYDFGLLLRDLGPRALDAALAAYASGGGAPLGLGERALFYARCKLMEDLSFGHLEGRREYLEKSLAAWPWTFGGGSRA